MRLKGLSISAEDSDEGEAEARVQLPGGGHRDRRAEDEAAPAGQTRTRPARLPALLELLETFLDPTQPHDLLSIQDLAIAKGPQSFFTTRPTVLRDTIR